MAGDLHTHTNFSDGSTDIEVLPFLASRTGLTHLAVSDHDTALAAQYAYAHPVEYDVTLIPAVELTAFDTARGRRVHILCYYPDLTSKLCAFFDLMAQRRNIATGQSAAELELLYPQFTKQAAEKYAARSGVIFKTHLSRVLFDYGFTDGIYKELYHELFGSQGGKILHNPAYETVETVLSLIREARGVAVLAHPSVYKSMELAAELAEKGLIDGVEIEHPRNTQQDKETLRLLAARHNLIVTGGSDFHGMHSARPLPLGICCTTDAAIEQIQELARQRKENHFKEEQQKEQKV